MRNGRIGLDKPSGAAFSKLRVPQPASKQTAHNGNKNRFIVFLISLILLVKRLTRDKWVVLHDGEGVRKGTFPVVVYFFGVFTAAVTAP
jgi:hypothetical protein